MEDTRGLRGGGIAGDLRQNQSRGTRRRRRSKERPLSTTFTRQAYKLYWAGILIVLLTVGALIFRGEGVRVPEVQRTPLVEGEGIEKVLNFIDAKADELVDLLRQAVAIQSISVGSARDDSGLRQGRDYFIKLAKIAGLDEVRVEGPEPGVILARRSIEGERDPNLQTILVYAHWDVQPAEKGSGGWEQDPFKIRREGDRLYGRGASDDKAALVSWLFVLEQFRLAKVDIPVDLRLMVEGAEEIGSPDIQEVISAENHTRGFLNGVQHSIVSDGSFLTDKPTIMVGTRGVMHFNLAIVGPDKDLHSGTFGGGVYEPMTEMIKILSSLSDSKSSPLIDGLKGLKYDRIDQKELQAFDLDLKEWEVQAGVTRAQESDKAALLEKLWGRPTLTIHGIRSTAGYEPAAISKAVEAHFSLRLPAGINLDEVERVTTEHVQKSFDSFKSPNELKIEVSNKGPGFSTSSGSKLHAAVQRATEKIRGVKPEDARLGGAIPVAAMLAAARPESAVLVVPIGGKDDNAHGYESMSVTNLMDGAKTFALLLHEIAVDAS